MLNALAFLPEDLDHSEDMSHGWAVLQACVPAGHWQVVRTAEPGRWLAEHAESLRAQDGPLLVIYNPMLTVCRDLVATLHDALRDSRAPCVIPADRSGVGSPAALYYATLRGLERDAAGLRARPPFAYDGRPVHLALFADAGSAVQAAGAPALPTGSLIVPGALVHDHSAYYAGERPEVLALLPERIGRFLDVGGGEGKFAASVRQAKGCEAHVAELNPAVAARAADRVDRVWAGDIFGQAEMPRFDCITALDMVEHVDNPEALIACLGNLLNEDGRLVVSLPNLGHWSVVGDLLEGYWDYIAVGIACRTHRRFFSRSTMEDLFSRAGWIIERCESTLHPAPPGWVERLAALGKDLALNVDAASLETYAYLVVARRQ
ncbi:MAG: class I SAM-dependent methyltransferase [Rhodocyclales bacterium GT-UBC]|nr:MAG: class I SAM-dependent methyltransferase [Rhodocyclales bacterium GT-UBC]